MSRYFATNDMLRRSGRSANQGIYSEYDLK